mmetsp:Transcript_13975/g.47182  ORF Transcript_13975/g.47182 Transcript_13975/m.47182 type:complete len:215 (-) Transcript_13975:162-806(-)
MRAPTRGVRERRSRCSTPWWEPGCARASRRTTPSSARASPGTSYSRRSSSCGTCARRASCPHARPSCPSCSGCTAAASTRRPWRCSRRPWRPTPGGTRACAPTWPCSPWRCGRRSPWGSRRRRLSCPTRASASGCRPTRCSTRRASRPWARRRAAFAPWRCWIACGPRASPPTWCTTAPRCRCARPRAPRTKRCSCCGAWRWRAWPPTCSATRA